MGASMTARSQERSMAVAFRSTRQRERMRKEVREREMS